MMDQRMYRMEENMAKLWIGCVAWGLPGGGYFAPEIAKKAGLGRDDNWNLEVINGAIL